MDDSIDVKNMHNKKYLHSAFILCYYQLVQFHFQYLKFLASGSPNFHTI